MRLARQSNYTMADKYHRDASKPILIYGSQFHEHFRARRNRPKLGDVSRAVSAAPVESPGNAIICQNVFWKVTPAETGAANASRMKSSADPEPSRVTVITPR